MSLIGSRVGLRHLCEIERDATADSSDSWGDSPTPEWQSLAIVPCNAWTNAGRELTASDRTAVLEDRRASVPLGTDVTERDRVAQVTTKGGAVVFEGPMNVEAVLHMDDHLELVLERVR